ncbi:hypothetical protein DFJ73DRAFT_929896 [Zopfochytrium polystomum]|nr:hypothetical protein DFJ73DRAFT_929896 [Zopfochytrium polystomum]
MTMMMRSSRLAAAAAGIAVLGTAAAATGAPLPDADADRSPVPISSSVPVVTPTPTSSASSPPPTAVPHAFAYLGCYPDREPGSILFMPYISPLENLTQLQCAEECASRSQWFSAMEDGFRCLCGGAPAVDYVAAKLDDGECNSICVGDGGVGCGGEKKASLYMYFLTDAAETVSPYITTTTVPAPPTASPYTYPISSPPSSPESTVYTVPTTSSSHSSFPTSYASAPLSSYYSSTSPQPPLTSVPHAYVSYGCFADPQLGSIFSPLFISPKQNLTQLQCAEECAAHQLQWSATENGFQCFCGSLTASGFAQKVPEAECNSVCTGSGGVGCGGVGKASVFAYFLTSPSDTHTAPFLSTTTVPPTPTSPYSNPVSTSPYFTVPTASSLGRSSVPSSYASASASSWHPSLPLPSLSPSPYTNPLPLSTSPTVFTVPTASSGRSVPTSYGSASSGHYSSSPYTYPVSSPPHSTASSVYTVPTASSSGRSSLPSSYASASASSWHSSFPPPSLSPYPTATSSSAQPSLTSQPHVYIYIGCFADPQLGSIFSSLFISPKQNLTQLQCAEECAAHQLQESATEDGFQCVCGRLKEAAYLQQRLPDGGL